MYLNSKTMQLLRDRMPSGPLTGIQRLSEVKLEIDEGIADGIISPWPSHVLPAYSPILSGEAPKPVSEPFQDPNSA